MAHNFNVGDLLSRERNINSVLILTGLTLSIYNSYSGNFQCRITLIRLPSKVFLGTNYHAY